MCWVSSRETSSRSPNIISSSSWAFACGDSSSTGGSRLRGTRGVFLGCFLGVLMTEMGNVVSIGILLRLLKVCRQTAYFAHRSWRLRSMHVRHRRKELLLATCG